jgi:RsiW-degrading membrane proteinase PrsW (M82 family)
MRSSSEAKSVLGHALGNAVVAGKLGRVTSYENPPLPSPGWSSATGSAGPSWLSRLSWVGVLAAGAGAYMLELTLLTRTNNPNFFPSLLLLGSIVVPLAVLVFAASGGRRVVAPVGWTTAVAVVGGVIGTLAAGFLEYDTLRGLSSGAMILVGLIEESAKLIIPAMVLVFLARQHPKAGVVIGVASGMGFATLETMGYGFTALLQQGSLSAVESTLQLRALLSPAGHVAWTGLTVAALWRIPLVARKIRALAVALATFVAAVLLHASWDGSNSLTVHVLVGTVSFVALLLVIHRVHKTPAPDRPPLPLAQP